MTPIRDYIKNRPLSMSYNDKMHFIDEVVMGEVARGTRVDMETNMRNIRLCTHMTIENGVYRNDPSL